MSFQKYERLDQDSISSEDTEGLLTHQSKQRQSKSLSRYAKLIFNVGTVVFIVLSILFNAFLLFQLSSLKNQCNTRELHPKTDYIDLRMDLPLEIREEEESLYDPFWNSPVIDDNLGVVALSAEFVKEKNLPASQAFPWDETKSVYILSFHHSLHCLRWIRQSILESHTGRPQSAELGHLTHCVNVLRSDTYCHADDTPRYSGRFHEQANAAHPKSGIGQQRQCVDFDKLYDFAIENSACYGIPDDPDAPAEDYFKNCPGGRVLWDQ